MRASILPLYLIGNRRAILAIAATRWSVLIGGLFVISAGFAREYDGQDLLHEPWHALRPLAASLVLGTVLFLMIQFLAEGKSDEGAENKRGFHTCYMSFIGLYWMTAPMAWLYAIPYERFMSPVDAVEANLWTLAFVALWRIILISRVISVVYGVAFAACAFLVMLFADVVVFAAVNLAPTPVIDVMGGLRQSEQDQLVAGISFMTLVLSVLTAPVWIIGAAAAAFVFKPKWPAMPEATSRSRGLLILSVVSVFAFAALVPFGAPPQMNRVQAERLLKQGRVTEAFALMSERSADQYPPGWDPPPRAGRREPTPSLDLVRDAMREQWPADWVADIYLDKLNKDLLRRLDYLYSDDSWSLVVDRLLQDEFWLRRDLRCGPDIEFLLTHDRSLSAEDRAALEALREAVESARAEPQISDDSPQP